MSILITLDSDQFDDAYHQINNAYHQFDNAAYIWRATGEVASTAWFYDVVVYPTSEDNATERWTAPAKDYRVSVCVCSHLNHSAYREEFTLDKLVDDMEVRGSLFRPKSS